MKQLGVSVFLAAGVLLTASESQAGWGLRNSFGQGIWLVPPDSNIPIVTAQAEREGQVLKTETRLEAGCGGSLCYDGNRRQPINMEVMPYYSFGLISLDLGILFNLESRQDLGFNFGFRPGVRVFPLLGLYARGFLELTAAQISDASAVTGAVRASFEGNLGLGIGYQFKLGPWGVFAEANFNPRLWGRGNFSMPVEFRLGIALEP